MSKLTENQYDYFPTKHMISGVKLYIEDHVESGGFLMAVIKNDLKTAIMRADSMNKMYIQEILWWFMEHAPHECWGSAEKAEAWLEKRKIEEAIEDIINPTDPDPII